MRANRRIELCSTETSARMRLLVLVLSAVAVVMADHRKHSLFLEPRLIGSAMRISRLSKEIRELEHEIKDAAKIDPLGFAKEMHARLDRVEGNCLYVESEK